MPIVDRAVRTGRKYLGRRTRSETALLALLVLACVALTYYCHFVRGIEIVFTHFFYVPVVWAGFSRGSAVFGCPLSSESASWFPIGSRT